MIAVELTNMKPALHTELQDSSAKLHAALEDERCTLLQQQATVTALQEDLDSQTARACIICSTLC